MHMQTNWWQPQPHNPKQVSDQYSPGNFPELSLSPQDRRAPANAGADLVVLILLAASTYCTSLVQFTPKALQPKLCNPRNSALQMLEANKVKKPNLLCHCKQPS